MDNASSQNVHIHEFVERLKTISGQQFLRYLNEKKIKTTCQMCGHNGRQVIDETNYTTVQDRLENREPHTFVTFFYHTPGIPVDSTNNYYYRLTCDNCGFITQHSTKYVLRWLDEKDHFDQQLAQAMQTEQTDDKLKRMTKNVPAGETEE